MNSNIRIISMAMSGYYFYGHEYFCVLLHNLLITLIPNDGNDETDIHSIFIRLLKNILLPKLNLTTLK